MLLEAAGFGVRSYASAAAFLAASEVGAAGCLILDLRMPEMTGLELQAELIRRGIRLPVIFYSAFGDVTTAVRAMQGGAADFLTKPANGRDLIERVRQVLDQEAERQRLEAAKDELLSRLARLSRRERQVLALALVGKTNKEIADSLGLSPRTVENHRSRIFLRIGVDSLLDLMQRATAAGLVLSFVDEPPGDLGDVR